MSSSEEILGRHFEASEQQDIDTILEDYADDAVVISHGEVFRGHDEIRDHYEAMFAGMGDGETTFTMDEQIVEEDCIQFIYRMETPESVWEFATDTMVIQDEEIIAHTAVAKVSPKD